VIWAQGKLGWAGVQIGASKNLPRENLDVKNVKSSTYDENVDWDRRIFLRFGAPPPDFVALMQEETCLD
jgi:hypothetical protein